MKPDAKTIERAAAEWLARHEVGLTPAEEREFEEWLDADERHGASYLDLQRSWARFERLRGTAIGARLETETTALARLSAGYPLHPAGRSGFRPWISGALAASVVWAVVYFAWWRPAHLSGPYLESVATEIGVMRSMKLPDGSEVRLNTNSALEVLFTKSERRVRLARGEAFFTIAKNTARPFIVNAAGVDVRAVGTEFNVRLHADAVEVVVSEGKVRVDDAANGASLLAPSGTPIDVAPILSAGHRVMIPVAPVPRPMTTPVAPVAVAEVEIERALAWRERRLVFESAPLAEIVAEFNRYNRRPFVVVGSELAARRFGGTFDANDQKTFVELLRTSEDITSEERPAEIVLRLRR